MLHPFYMLTGKIDLLKESKPFKLNGKIYTEKTYIDERGSRSIIAVPITPPSPQDSKAGGFNHETLSR